MNPAWLEAEDELAGIVRNMRSIAVVGIKDETRPDEAAYTLPAMFVAEGLEVIGINPRVPLALGQRTLSSVSELDRAVDVLDVFRRSDAIPGLADEILSLPAHRRPRVVWLQSGIRNDDAAERLAAAGMQVVQDRCLGVYIRRYR